MTNEYSKLEDKLMQVYGTASKMALLRLRLLAAAPIILCTRFPLYFIVSLEIVKKYAAAETPPLNDDEMFTLALISSLLVIAVGYTFSVITDTALNIKDMQAEEAAKSRIKTLMIGAIFLWDMWTLISASTYNITLIIVAVLSEGVLKLMQIKASEVLTYAEHFTNCLEEDMLIRTAVATVKTGSFDDEKLQSYLNNDLYKKYKSDIEKTAEETRVNIERGIQ